MRPSLGEVPMSKTSMTLLPKQIDWLILGGDRQVLGQFLKRVELPLGLDERISSWRVPVERPGQAALEDAVTSAWSSRLYEPPAAL